MTAPDPRQPATPIAVGFACPFCGRQAGAQSTGVDGDQLVLHSLPYCKGFQDTDALEFLILARVNRQSLN